MSAAVESLSSALDFTLSMWAMEADRARAAEHRAASAEIDLQIARRPWWKRRAS